MVDISRKSSVHVIGQRYFVLACVKETFTRNGLFMLRFTVPTATLAVIGFATLAVSCADSVSGKLTITKFTGMSSVHGCLNFPSPVLMRNG